MMERLLSWALSITLAEIKAMGLPTDKGAMFLLAAAIAILSVGSIVVEKARSRRLPEVRPRSRSERLREARGIAPAGAIPQVNDLVTKWGAGMAP